MTDIHVEIGTRTAVKIEDFGDELQEGDRALVWCQGCHISFEWECQNGNYLPPRYHSKSCKKRTQRRRNSGQFFSCPTPSKVRYTTGLAAEEAFRRISARTGDLENQPYHCRCGVYHLGHVTWVKIHE